MKCVIPKPNVKILARAIHSLARVGDELYIEPTPAHLLFRTLSSSKSAFAEFKMAKCFFSSYIYSDQDSGCHFKILMKSCLNVFKSTNVLDKQVEYCEVRLKPDGSVIVFEIKFSNSCVKKYCLPVLDSEKIQPDFATDSENKIEVSSKFMSSCVKNFRSNEEEFSIAVDENRLLFNNNTETSREMNLLRTELNFQPSEFESYHVGKPTAVVFCAKELKSVVAFAEPANLTILLSFDEPGQPLECRVSHLTVYTLTVVVSTLNLVGSQLNQVSRSESRANVVSRLSITRPDEPSTPTPPPVVDTSVIPESEQPSELHQLEGQESQELDQARGVDLSFLPELSSSINLPYSQPSLIRKVFSRCFTRSSLLDSLPGHDIVLVQFSDDELRAS